MTDSFSFFSRAFSIGIAASHLFPVPVIIIGSISTTSIYFPVDFYFPFVDYPYFKLFCGQKPSHEE
jgi:hypothetical protein